MFDKPIDNGFFEITESQARKLCGTLPPHGREKLVAHDEKHYWVARTTVGGKQVWSIRQSAWKLTNCCAVLS